MSFLTIVIVAASFFTLCLLIFYFTHHKLKSAQARLKAAMTKQGQLVTELAKLQEKYTQNVLYDPLTDLPKRHIFEDRLMQTIHQSKRYQTTFAVLFLDIDGFKTINDALGHDVGDALLQHVALRLKDSIRQVDSLSHFGNDEFLVILPLAKPETAAYVAHRLLSVIAEPIQIENQELFITTSAGIAVYPTDGSDAKTLLTHAGNALHQAKKQGRNTYQFFHEQMQIVRKREVVLSSALQQAGIYQEFFVYYQPQINVKTKKIISIQALLHWQHPEFGVLPLSEFLLFAENAGKINEIGEWLLRHVLQQLQAWQTAGFQANRVAVSVSMRQLENPHFTFKVSQILQETNMHPESLILEISEGMLLNKREIIENSIYMLKQLGVQIAMVDFGAGHLSLQHLKHFPIDYLKMAATLVQDLITNKNSKAIVKMIVALAQSLNVTIIAEGVENTEQAQLLEMLGCDVMQGNLMGQPQKASMFFETTGVEG